MTMDNATFFAGYNHLYHFHKATLLFHYYEHPDKYFSDVLNPLYSPLERESFFFAKDEVYFKKAVALDLRSTYFHCIETLFNLIGVFKREAECYRATGKMPNAFQALTEYPDKQLDEEIARYGSNSSELDWMLEVVEGSDWTYGRHIFFFGLTPPDDDLEGYLRQAETSLQAMKLGLSLLAADLVDKGEYNSYKHGLRVLDAMRTFFILNKETKEMYTVDATNTLTFPKKRRKSVEIATTYVDVVRDYRMCVLGARFIQMMINQRRIAYNKKSIDVEQVPISMFTEKSIRWHAERHVSNPITTIELEDFERMTGIKVSLDRDSLDDESKSSH
ncbi:MAG: hypothetical protein KDC03_18135 [Flavobacteriales bacterium]|nr:hypothetical protein [Flavobacteriales bacterium]